MSDHGPELPFEAYQKVDAINWSTLKHVATSPLEYQYRRENPSQATAAMRLGTATHLAVLEPNEFESRYIAQPDFGDLRFKANKQKRDEWLSDVGGREVLSAQDHNACLRMRDAVHAHEAARDLLSVGCAEVSFFWTDEPTGLRCKGRQDWIAPNHMVSFKTARDVTPIGFGRAVAKFLYHGQEAFYSTGYNAAHGFGGKREPTYFVAAQPVPPYDVGVYLIPPEVHEEGEFLCRRLLDTLNDCQARGTYPGSCPGIGVLAFPKWALTWDDEDASGLDLDVNGQAVNF